MKTNLEMLKHENIKLMSWIDILLDDQKEYNKYKEKGFSSEFLLKMQEQTIEYITKAMIESLPHHSMAEYMVESYGKEKSIEICDKNMEQGKSEFYIIKFLIDKI